jgi:hypothetical protein
MMHALTARFYRRCIASLLVALVLTFLQEVGQDAPWYKVLLVLGM